MNEYSGLSGHRRALEGRLGLRGARLQVEVLEKQSCPFHIRLGFDLVVVGVKSGTCELP